MVSRSVANFPPSSRARPCTHVRTSPRYCCRMWPTPLGFQIARVAVGAILADFRVAAEGDATSGPHGFSVCGEFPAIFPMRTIRSRRRARSASLSGARHGLVPKRKGQLGHLTAVHLRTSLLEPPQQSRQCARIAAVGSHRAAAAPLSQRADSGPRAMAPTSGRRTTARSR